MISRDCRRASNESRYVGPGHRHPPAAGIPAAAPLPFFEHGETTCLYGEFCWFQGGREPRAGTEKKVVIWSGAGVPVLL